MYGGGGYIQVCGFNICDFGDIFRSSDGGSSWQRVADKLDDYVVALAISPSGRVFAGTSEGIFRNFAEFWHKISPNNTRSLFVDPATNAVFAGTSGGIWRSLSEGENWDFVLASNFVWSFAKDLDGNILAGTQTEGVLESSDNGATWVSLSSGLQKMDVRALAVDPNTGQLFAGLANGSVFKSMNPTTAVQEITGVLPNDFALEQNYPNPFNPSTVIRFQLPVSSEVKLTIYNLTGQLVRTLVDAQKSAGRHEVVWDGRSDAGERLPSGVYLYRIEAGDFRAVRRLAMVE